MTKREFTEYLQDILIAINQIEDFTFSLTVEDFNQNKVIFLAVIQSIIVIGEAVKNVPADVRENYPDIPWKSIAGMRDKLVHEYWAIDEKVIWKVVTNSLPQLKINISQVIEDVQSNEQ